MYSRFFDLSHDILCITDAAGTYLAVNDSWIRVLGWSPIELTDSSYVDYIHPDDLEPAAAYLETAVAANGDDPGTIRVRMRGADGDYRCIDWHSVYDREDERLFAAGRDCTHEEAMRERLERREAMLTKLVAEQLRTRDHEHARIVGDLHDSAMQHCIAALMYLEAVEAREDDGLPEQLESARTQVRQALAAMRRVMTGLDAIEPSSGALGPALCAIAAAVGEHFGMDVTTDVAAPVVVSDEIAATACRTAREGLVNAGKHASGSNVTLTVCVDAGTTLLVRVSDSVDDRQPGVRPPRGATAATGAGLGLPTLAERVRDIGGDLDFEHTAVGATLTARLPLAHRHESGAPG
jgi:PAS domain S-box-containing protein